MDGQTDRRMDKQTDGWVNKRTVVSNDLTVSNSTGFRNDSAVSGGGAGPDLEDVPASGSGYTGRGPDDFSRK
jgi:hypothetical protein